MMRCLFLSSILGLGLLTPTIRAASDNPNVCDVIKPRCIIPMSPVPTPYPGDDDPDYCPPPATLSPSMPPVSQPSKTPFTSEPTSTPSITPVTSEPTSTPSITPVTSEPTGSPIVFEGNSECVTLLYADFESNLNGWSSGGSAGRDSSQGAAYINRGNDNFLQYRIPQDNLMGSETSTTIKIKYSLWATNTEDNDAIIFELNRQQNNDNLYNEFSRNNLASDLSKTNQMMNQTEITINPSQSNQLDLRIYTKLSADDETVYFEYISIESCEPPPTPFYDCPIQILNFNDLTPGTYVKDLSKGPTTTITVTAIGKSSTNSYTPNGAAMVFNTADPVMKDCGTDALHSKLDGDPDLGSPNNQCDPPGIGIGPGDGDGGQPGSPHPNCEPIGNVLVIQERAFPEGKPCPDDTSDGGFIIFDFEPPVSLAIAKLLDVDEGRTPQISVSYEDENGTPMAGVTKVTWTGDNGVITEYPNYDRVSKVSIEYWGSGSIAEIGYYECPPSLPVFEGKSVQCEPGFFGVASSFGDPHIETFDDLEYSCMGFGDYILSKSKTSSFEIQGRFSRPDHITNLLSWTRGMAFLEGSPGLPSIEFSYAPYRQSTWSDCSKYFVENGNVVTNPSSGMTWTSDDGETTMTFNIDGNKWILSVTKDDHEMLSLVLESFRQRLSNPGHNSCSSTLTVKMDLCYRADEHIVGVFGNNNGEPGDDWMNYDGSMVIRPASSNYDFKYCERWCISNPDDSLFTYNAETVGTFADISHCDPNAEYDEAAYIASVPQEIRDLCLERAHNFANCVIESTIGDPEEFFHQESLLAQNTAEELKFVVCSPNDANCGTDWGQKEELVTEDTMHPVMCCASQNMQNYNGWSIVGSLWSFSPCGEMLNYRQAENYCRDLALGDDNVAPRVCTAREILDAEVSTSCNYGGAFVWSSTGPGANVVHQKVAACGNINNPVCKEQLNDWSAVAANPEQRFSVRCCADQAISGFSHAKCNNDYWNDQNIWSDSDTEQFGCYQFVTYDNAQQFCKSLGGRLCTYEEVYEGCTRGTGCGFDTNVIWTSTSTYSLP